MPQITTVLFDLDGTIADTNEVILRALRDTLEHASGRRWQREEILPHWGLLTRDQIAKACPDVNVDAVIPYYRQRYAAHYARRKAEFPGMRSVLQALQRAEYNMGVVTSRFRPTAHVVLEDLNLADFFQVVVCYEDTERHKPAPDPLLFALKKLNEPARKAVYVGDNPDDIAAARAAGMSAIAVGWSMRTRDALEAAAPDCILTGPSDLLHWLNFDGDIVASLSTV